MKLWGSRFISKCSKFYVYLKNAIKFPQKASGFLDNCIWIGCEEFSLLWQEYLSSAVDVLTKSPKILDLTKIEVLQLNLCQNDGK